MPLLSALFLVANLQQPAAPAPPDPMQLNIGKPGKAIVQPESILNTSTSKVASLRDIVLAAEGKRFVFLGESHDRLRHHKLQAAVIQALAKAGRDVVVGFEMFTRPVQDKLNPWSLGWWSEEEFIRQSEWKTQWGFDYALYKPIFDVVRQNRLPMVALNVPRDWVRRVGRTGASGLTAEEQSQVPPIDTSNAQHREVFNALMGGHPMTGPQGENIYSAQVLWDIGMADSALKYLDSRVNNSKTVFVVVAGSGHVMYRQAINYRIKQRTGEDGVTVVMTESNDPVTVSLGVGDFVYVSQADKN